MFRKETYICSVLTDCTVDRLQTAVIRLMIYCQICSKLFRDRNRHCNRIRRIDLYAISGQSNIVNFHAAYFVCLIDQRRHFTGQFCEHALICNRIHIQHEAGLYAFNRNARLFIRPGYQLCDVIDGRKKFREGSVR